MKPLLQALPNLLHLKSRSNDAGLRFQPAMVRPMSIQVPADVEKLISIEMRERGYASEADVLREGLRVLAERNSDLAAIAEGIADMEAGRVIPVQEAEAALREKLGLPNRS